jgi:tRNA (guanine-N7-)-methyltransferase
MVNPKDFIITRKRKKYKFAVFANSDLCFEADEWKKQKDFTPTVLEVGAGTAQFSAGLAKELPEVNFVACDLKADRLMSGARLVGEYDLKNIRFVRTHAEKLPELFTARSLTAVWLTFPDPFPKKRAAKHRLTHQRFLKLYETLLANDGALYFKTDNHALFDWSLESLVVSGWQIDQLTYDLHEAELPAHYKIITAYEQRYLNEKATICFVRAYPPRPAPMTTAGKT